MTSTVTGAPTVSTGTDSLPSPTSTADAGGGSSSSPLLFFVALGFVWSHLISETNNQGVLFTNLWFPLGKR
jgi:hypothetical protein